jgi:hypothetical protein
MSDYDVFPDCKFLRFLESYNFCKHEKFTINSCGSLGWVAGCMECRVHTPIAHTLDEARDLWTRGVVINLTEEIIHEYFGFNKFFDFVSHQINYVKSFWFTIVKKKEFKHNKTIADITKRIRRIHRACRGINWLDINLDFDNIPDTVSDPVVMDIKIDKLTGLIADGCKIVSIAPDDYGDVLC